MYRQFSLYAPNKAPDFGGGVYATESPYNKKRKCKKAPVSFPTGAFLFSLQQRSNRHRIR